MTIAVAITKSRAAISRLPGVGERMQSPEMLWASTMQWKTMFRQSRSKDKPRKPQI
jgi:hypothetical protein